MLPKFTKCIVFRVGDSYRAICFDFSLVAEAQSRAQAQARLWEQVADYAVDVALEGYPKHLVHRSVGFFERLKLTLRHPINSLFTIPVIQHG